MISAEEKPRGYEIEGLAIPGYDTNTEIQPGFPHTIEFDAASEGTWEMICSIDCRYGHDHMKGIFVIR